MVPLIPFKFPEIVSGWIKAAYCVSGLCGFSLSSPEDILCLPGYLQLKLSLVEHDLATLDVVRV